MVQRKMSKGLGPARMKASGLSDALQSWPELQAVEGAGPQSPQRKLMLVKTLESYSDQVNKINNPEVTKGHSGAY